MRQGKLVEAGVDGGSVLRVRWVVFRTWLVRSAVLHCRVGNRRLMSRAKLGHWAWVSRVRGKRKAGSAVGIAKVRETGGKTEYPRSPDQIPSVSLRPPPRRPGGTAASQKKGPTRRPPGLAAAEQQVVRIKSGSASVIVVQLLLCEVPNSREAWCGQNGSSYRVPVKFRHPTSQPRHEKFIVLSPRNGFRNAPHWKLCRLAIFLQTRMIWRCGMCVLCVEPLGHWRSDGRSSVVSGLQVATSRRYIL